MREIKVKSQPGRAYSEEIRLSVIQEYLSGASGKELALKYKIYNASVISHWIRKFRQTNSLLKQLPMKKRVRKGYQSDSEKSVERQNALLKKELAAKEKDLSDAQMKARAYEMMIEIAEKQFDIPIRKKSGPKQ